MKRNETITLAWCDNGSTEGKFTESIATILLEAHEFKAPILNFIRVQGNQIGRQRQAAFDMWADQIKTDWILWIDSDIHISPKELKLMIDSADEDHKVVSGVYFIAKEYVNGLMEPMPAIFDEVDKFAIKYHHPLPYNQLIKVDCAGMGLILMHKSIVEKLRKNNPSQSVFAEQEGIGDEYISEDIVFFRKLKKSGIQAYAHTGALADHIKRVPLNASYYMLYWNNYKENDII